MSSPHNTIRSPRSYSPRYVPIDAHRIPAMLDDLHAIRERGVAWYSLHRHLLVLAREAGIKLEEAA